jgi:hypothetical protein
LCGSADGAVRGLRVSIPDTAAKQECEEQKMDRADEERGSVGHLASPENAATSLLFVQVFLERRAGGGATSLRN